MLTGTDTNTLQEFCLQTYLFRKESEKFQQEERDFETKLFLHRPEVYEQYLKDKKEKEDLGFDHIEWKRPESVEELQQILGVIEKLEDIEGVLLDGPDSNKEVNDAIELEFLQQFEGIDISQLGKEENDG